MNTGVFDISIETYHANEGVSKSGLTLLKRSPLHFWHQYINPDKPVKVDSPATILGNAVHTYILENDRFKLRYFVAEKMSRATTAGKAYWADIETHHSDKIILNIEEFALIQQIADSIDRHPHAKSLIAGAEFEKSLFWTDPETGILCKSRPDIWHTNMIVDLKTSFDAAPRKFQADLYSYGYYMQAAMIRDGIKHVFGVEQNNFIYLVIEKEAPFAIGIYQLDESALQRGAEDYKKLLRKMKRCMDHNDWSAYPTTTVTLPNYANYEMIGDE